MLSRDATALALLRAMRARLDRPESWTKGRYQDGDKCCLAGAAILEGYSLYEAEGRLSELLGVANVVGWNDASDRTHADIIARLDEAIEREKTNVSS